MPNPNEKLADALDALKRLQDKGQRVFQSKELSRVHRERLLKNGFLQNVMKGWLISANPGEHAGDTTPWYASFREFCARYCNARFGDEWHLSPEQSLLLHAGHTVIPSQVIIYTPKGTNNTVELLYGTSLYDLKQPDMPPHDDLEQNDDLRLYATHAALLKVPEGFFQRYPVEAQVLLSAITDPSDLLRRLLAGGHSAIAGRLVGAFRRVGKEDIADEIISTMKAADYVIRETDPFEPERIFATIATAKSPTVGRLQALWASHRQTIIDIFPKSPGLPGDKDAYIKAVDEVYTADAYHSLSIEGYRVSPELVDQVRSGDWNPDNVKDHRDVRDALAARGYWQAFQTVKADVEKVIKGEEAGKLASSAHRAWYRELFQPCVTAGLIKAEALAGYRNNPVYIKTSQHVPPRFEAVRNAMPTLFELLSNEEEASVRAVLGHWLFGYVHPYPDGNGRVARFLMNLMLASGGYPWTVIRVEDRDRYMTALESASVKDDIQPFAEFLTEQVQRPVPELE
ncbi:Fic family protein [Henriciella sp.]|uniref:Fic family protein n=1 Tax=Henriciella sp. TaxID=1968823 RepID=UPI00263037B0|nr:Fic family protein [Henriciella sp.]